MHLDPRLRGEEYDSDEEEEIVDDQETQLGYNPQLGQEEAHYDRDLDYSRQAKKRKLQHRFESIFEKYGKDFEGIGDEIDLETGLVVVDNGHLRNMKHEVDPGDHTGAVDGNTDAQTAQNEGEVDNDEDSGSDGGSEDGFGADDDEDSDGFDGNSGDDGNVDAAPDNILDQIPLLRASMMDLQAKQKRGQGMNEDAIAELGASIAKQLADFVNRNDKHAPKRKRKRKNAQDPVWSYPDLQGQEGEQRQLPRRRMRTPSPLPEYIGPSPGEKSLWAPMRHPKPRKKRSDAKQHDFAPESDQEEDEVSELAESAAGEIIRGGNRECYNCQCTNSLIWRYGPEGIMCNACGMYYYRYGLIRPVEPPSESEYSESSEESDAAVEENQSQYSANTSRRLVGVKLYKNERFKTEDDAMLIKLKEIDRFSWERIAKHFDGRTAYGLQCRYSKKLHARPVEARAFLVNQGYESRHDENGVITFSPAPQKQLGWTEEEDDLLLKLREDESLEWEKIAESFPERTGRAMERRFRHLHRKLLSQQSGRPKKKKTKKRLDPFARFRQRYSELEDEVIVKLREVDKLSWAEISEQFPGRNAMALQKRYVRELAHKDKGLGVDPLAEDGGTVFHSNPLKFSRYIAEEDEMLLHLRQDLGLDFKEIEQRMPGRKSQSLENRYQYILMKGSTTGNAQALGAAAVSGGDSGEQTTLTPDADGTQSEDELMQDTEELISMSFSDPLTQSTSFNDSGISMDSDTGAVEKQLTGAESESIAQSVEQIAKPRTGGRITLPHEFQIKPGARWTQEEIDLVSNCRDQGMPWPEIAGLMPGRSESAIKNYHNQYMRNVKKRKPVRVVQRDGSDLLRHAVGNTMRRYSESAGSLTSRRNSVQDLGAGESGDEASKQIEREMLSWIDGAGPLTNGLLPSALPRDTMTLSGAVDGFEESCQRQISNSTDPETSREHSPSLDYSPVATAGLIGSYVTPARYDQRTHPYYVDAPAKAHIVSSPNQPPSQRMPAVKLDYGKVRSASQPVPYNEETIGAKKSSTLLDTHVSVASVAELQYPASKLTCTKRDVRVTADEHTMHEEPGLDTESAVERETSPGDTTLSDGEGDATDEDVAETETDDDEEQSTYEEEAEAAEAATRDASVYGAASDEEPDDVTDDPPLEEFSRVNELDTTAADEEPPPYSCVELVTMALELNAPYPLRSKEVHEYIMDNFGYFKNISTHCNQKVRSTLHSKPEFVKVSNDRKALWALKDAARLANEEDHESDRGSADDERSAEEGEAAADGKLADEQEVIPTGVSFDEDKPETSTARVQQSRSSLVEIITTIFKSNGSKPMRSRELCAAVEEEFPHFKQNNSHWKDSLRGLLSSKPDFVKLTNDRAALWGLRESVQSASVEEIREQSIPQDELRVTRSARTQPAKTPRKRGRPRIHPRGPTQKLDASPPKRASSENAGPASNQASTSTNGLRRSQRTVRPSTKYALESAHYQIVQEIEDTDPENDMSEAEPQRSDRADTEDVINVRSSSQPRLFVSPDEPQNEVKEEEQDEPEIEPPESTKAVGSGFQKDPERLPFTGTPHDSFMTSFTSFNEDVDELSSSPILTMKTPGHVYGKAGTPATDRSLLFGRPQHRSVAELRSSFGGLSSVSRSSSVAPRSRKRIVYTPVRDVDDSEDELA